MKRASHRVRLSVESLSRSVFTLLAIGALAGLCPLIAQDRSPLAVDIERFEAFIDPLMKRCLDEAHVPGGVFVLVGEGRILFSGGYGLADLESRTPVDPARSRFHVGSISKTVTATAVMQLVEAGKLDLDTDVNTYLKSYQIPATFPQPVTLRNLLTHTAGFDENNIGRLRPSWSAAPPLGEFLDDLGPSRAYPPGEICIYTNHAAAISGLIVEEVTGIPFSRYVAERIVAPLGMSQSGFFCSDAALPDLATSYRYVKERFERRPPSWHVEYPAAMFAATGDDMGRFLVAHLGGGLFEGNRILGGPPSTSCTRDTSLIIRASTAPRSVSSNATRTVCAP